MPRSKLKSPDMKKTIAEATIKNVKVARSSNIRYRMIAEAAYFRAETRGFVGGDAARDWLEAEAEIDKILQC
jgi:Protein of unknown function (DUF2934)